MKSKIVIVIMDPRLKSTKRSLKLCEGELDKRQIYRSRRAENLELLVEIASSSEDSTPGFHQMFHLHFQGDI